MAQSMDAGITASGDNQENSARSTHPAELAVLDADLRNRLHAVADEQQSGEDRFHPSRPVIFECFVWLLLGAALWVLTLLMWR